MLRSFSNPGTLQTITPISATAATVAPLQTLLRLQSLRRPTPRSSVPLLSVLPRQSIRNVHLASDSKTAAHLAFDGHNHASSFRRKLAKAEKHLKDVETNKLLAGGKVKLSGDIIESIERLVDTDDYNTSILDHLEEGHVVEVRIEDSSTAFNYGIVLNKETFLKDKSFCVLLPQGRVYKLNKAQLRWSTQISLVPSVQVEDLWNGIRHMEAEFSDVRPKVIPQNLHGEIQMDVNLMDKGQNTRIVELAQRVPEIYKAFAKTDNHVVVTFIKAAEALGLEPNVETVIAIRRLVLENSKLFRTEGNTFRYTSTFWTRPEREVQLFERLAPEVRDLRRFILEGRNVKKEGGRTFKVFDSFIQKCQKLIDESRAAQAKAKVGVPIVAEQKPELKFTAQEMYFVDLVKAACDYGNFQVMQEEMLALWIVDQTKRYTKYGDGWLQRFLAEIGLGTPWGRALGEEFNLPGLGWAETRKKIMSIEEEIQNDPKAAWERLGLKDSMAGLRKDWGETVAYAFDDVETVDVDDALSIEHINDKEAWVHVHVANPTAFVPKNSDLFNIAKLNDDKGYFPETVAFMLPPSFAPKFFGLETGQKRPVITFSGRYNKETGELLEEKVQHGIINNVKRISYQDGNSAAGLIEPSSESLTILPPITSPEPKEKKSTGHVTPSEVTVIKDLQSLANAVEKASNSNNIYEFVSNAGKLNVSVDDGHHKMVLTRSSTLPPSLPVIYSGTPAVSLWYWKPSLTVDSTQRIVQTFMQQAGRIAASYCASHSLPVPFRVSKYSPNDPSASAAYTALVHKAQSSALTIQDIFSDQNAHLLTLEYSTTPAPNRIMNLPHGYVKVTSPLRRFKDMITHYQIESHLLAAHSRTHPLTFSSSELQSYLAESKQKTQKQKLFATVCAAQWRMYALSYSLRHSLRPFSSNPAPVRVFGIVADQVIRPHSPEPFRVNWSMLDVPVRFHARKEHEGIKLQPGDLVEGVVDLERTTEWAIEAKLVRVVRSAGGPGAVRGDVEKEGRRLVREELEARGAFGTKGGSWKMVEGVPVL